MNSERKKKASFLLSHHHILCIYNHSHVHLTIWKVHISTLLQIRECRYCLSVKPWAGLLVVIKLASRRVHGLLRRTSSLSLTSKNMVLAIGDQFLPTLVSASTLTYMDRSRSMFLLFYPWMKFPIVFLNFGISNALNSRITINSLLICFQKGC